jgi:hypothetical protein
MVPTGNFPLQLVDEYFEGRIASPQGETLDLYGHSPILQEDESSINGQSLLIKQTFEENQLANSEWIHY